ncbi:hypothetical protein P167DRAFT_534534 [Morchella conica CCBAS932]|uniref:Uncharacterized protein n=1 Tax=Morchella conica CCBAS932 TaxID=1392247 RepID=A0A3N4KXB6_9PEZI|nr:hypothetical protein P167DRAFT_534534 [Morchella conica CCBAS932]
MASLPPFLSFSSFPLWLYSLLIQSNLLDSTKRIQKKKEKKKKKSKTQRIKERIIGKKTEKKRKKKNHRIRKES